MKTACRILALALLALPLVARTVKLVWDHDGAPEYRMYEKLGEDWTLIKTVTGNPFAPKTMQLDDVPVGIHLYRVTAVVETDPMLESDPSNVVTVVVAAPGGRAPADIVLKAEETR